MMGRVFLVPAEESLRASGGQTYSLDSYLRIIKSFLRIFFLVAIFSFFLFSVAVS